MGKNITVSSFTELEATSKKLENHGQTYKNIYTRLLNCANTMGTAWEGADNQAFVQQIQGFADELKFMSEKLIEDSKLLHQQKENYVQRQDDNIAQVKKLKN